MSKKRKCRLTEEELAIHKEAVRLRNMTDRQLYEEFHRAAEPEEKTESTSEAGNGAQRLIAALENGEVKGIKGATAYKIAEKAKEMGLI